MLAAVSSRRILIAALALVAAAAVVRPSWAQAVGADVWNVPALHAQMSAAASERDQLAAEDDAVRGRIAVKESIVADLIAGRTTLPDATEQFAAMNASRPHYLTVIRQEYSGATDAEKAARNVISFAAVRVAASERSAVIGRLEAELHQMLAAGTAAR